MTTAQNAEPQLAPTDPAFNAKQKQAANDEAINDVLVGSSKVNEFVKQEPKFFRPKMNPYIVAGGKKKNEYNVTYKNISYLVKADSLLEAAQEGYSKIISDVPNFSKKKIKIGVQRKNKNRENHVYQFLVKKEEIKNPKYKHKVTFTKL